MYAHSLCFRADQKEEKEIISACASPPLLSWVSLVSSCRASLGNSLLQNAGLYCMAIWEEKVCFQLLNKTRKEVFHFLVYLIE